MTQRHLPPLPEGFQLETQVAPQDPQRDWGQIPSPPPGFQIEEQAAQPPRTRAPELPEWQGGAPVDGRRPVDGAERSQLAAARFQALEQSADPAERQKDRKAFIEAQQEKYLGGLYRAEEARSGERLRYEGDVKDSLSGLWNRVVHGQSYDQQARDRLAKRREFEETLGDDFRERTAERFGEKWDKMHEPDALFMKQRDDKFNEAFAWSQEHYPGRAEAEHTAYAKEQLSKAGYHPDAIAEDAPLTPEKEESGRGWQLSEVRQLGPVGDFVAGAVSAVPRTVGQLFSLGAAGASYATEQLGLEDLAMGSRWVADQSMKNTEWLIEKMGMAQREDAGVIPEVAYLGGSLIPDILLAGQTGRAAQAGLGMASGGRRASNVFEQINRHAPNLPASVREYAGYAVGAGYFGLKEAGAMQHYIYESLTAKGIDPKAANLRAFEAAAGVATTNTLLGMVPMQQYVMAPRMTRSRLLNAARAVTVEGSINAVQEFVAAMGEMGVGADDPRIHELVRRLGIAAGAGAAAAGPVGFARPTRGPNDPHYVQDRQQKAENFRGLTYSEEEAQLARADRQGWRAVRDPHDERAMAHEPLMLERAPITGHPQMPPKASQQLDRAIRRRQLDPDDTGGTTPARNLIEDKLTRVPENVRALTEAEAAARHKLEQAGGLTEALTPQERVLVGDYPDVIPSRREMSRLARAMDSAQRTQKEWSREMGALKHKADWRLMDIPLSMVRAANRPADPQVVDSMVQRPQGTVPPVILGQRATDDAGVQRHLDVMDGGARVVAAARRGETTIQAYVPAESAREFGLLRQPDMPQRRRDREKVQRETSRRQEEPTQQGPPSDGNTRATNLTTREQRLEQQLREEQTARSKAERAYRREYELARRDSLSQVYNRFGGTEALQQMIQQADESGRPITLMGIDLVLFKQVNDVLGHAMGDRAIQAAARSLESSVRSGEDGRPGDSAHIVTRLGGDEFEVALWNVTDEQAQMIGDRMRGAYRRAMDDLGIELPGGLKTDLGYGYVHRKPGDNRDLETLRKMADSDLEVRKAALKKAAGLPDRDGARAMIEEAQNRATPRTEAEQVRAEDQMADRVRKTLEDAPPNQRRNLEVLASSDPRRTRRFLKRQSAGRIRELGRLLGICE